MKAFVLAIASIFFAPVVLAQPGAILPAEKIKILSWNIYMLPGPIGYRNLERAEAIGSILASRDFDVIVFQEAFDAKARKRISRLLSPAFQFQAGPANRKAFSIKTNSGLWILSRYPIKHTASIIFKTRHGVDALSRKGALLVELEINGQLIQVVGTHLQNAGGEWLKQSQCVELYHRILRNNEVLGVPQIVCGDFNIKRNGSESDYRKMLLTLDATDGGIHSGKPFSYDRVNNDLRVEKGIQNDLIDYILIRPNQAFVHGVERNIQAIRSRWNSKHEDLSDHYPVEAEVHFQNINGIYTVSAPGQDR